MLAESGSVYTFGDGSNGQLGHGTTILVADTPQELSWGKNVKVKFASCGENSTSLITGSFLTTTIFLLFLLLLLLLFFHYHKMVGI